MAEPAESIPLSQGNEVSNYVLLSSSETCYSKYVLDTLNNFYKSKLDTLTQQHTIDSIVYKYKIDSLQLQQKKDLLENQNHEMREMWDTIISQGKKIEEYERMVNAFENANPENAKLVNHVKEINKLRGDSSSLQTQITELKEQLRIMNESQGKKNVEHSGKENNSIFSPENVPYVCGLLTVLIIAITVISLKRGLTFSKGNTSICIGEKKKTRTKKAD